MMTQSMKKLNLRKVTLANLNDRELTFALGGATYSCATCRKSECPHNCPPPDYSISPENCPITISTPTNCAPYCP